MTQSRSWSPQVLACLARRQALLQAPLQDIAALCASHLNGTEPSLEAWVTTPSLSPRDDATDEATDEVVLPLGVKDVIDVRGMTTRAGSRSRQRHPMAKADADVVARLRAAGYLPVGKTHTTEFAYTDPAPTLNPFDARRTPGGSSSGSAAAVGAAQVPVAIGTQTAGSVCRPAAFCGAYAFKPSTGSTSLQGTTPLAPSFDTIGAYGLRLRWAVDVAMVMVGRLDMRCRDDERAPDPRPLRIGLADDAYFRAVSPEIAQDLADVRDRLVAAGHVSQSVQLGIDFQALRAHHRLMMQFEGFRAHRHLLEYQQDIGPAWFALLKAGSAVTEQQYADARQSVEQARARMNAHVSDVDVMLIPPVSTAAPVGLHSTGDAGLIVPWTCAGSPLSVLPTRLDAAGAPLAVMLAGHAGDDIGHARISLQIDQVLRAAGHYIDAPTDQQRETAN